MKKKDGGGGYTSYCYYVQTDDRAQRSVRILWAWKNIIIILILWLTCELLVGM